MLKLVATMALLICVCALNARGAEQAAAPEATLEGQPLSRWLEQLGADEYGTREHASHVLSTADESVAPRLKAYRDQTTDLEVRVRLNRVLCAIIPQSFAGKFQMIRHMIVQPDGSTYAPGQQDKSTLEVSAGKILWTRDYPAYSVTQTYTFDAATPLAVRGECKIPLKWESIVGKGDTSPYSPDEFKASLTIQTTPAGPRLVLLCTDHRDTCGQSTFAPAPPEVEKPKDADKAPGDNGPNEVPEF
jgi:hypothetical protein